MGGDGDQKSEEEVIIIITIIIKIMENINNLNKKKKYNLGTLFHLLYSIRHCMGGSTLTGSARHWALRLFIFTLTFLFAIVFSHFVVLVWAGELLQLGPRGSR